MLLAACGVGRPDANPTATPAGAATPQADTSAPAAADDHSLVVLVSLLDLQQTWLRENLIRPLAKQQGTDARVVFYDDPSDLESMLKLDRDADLRRVGLALVDQTQLRRLAEKRRLRPFGEIVGGAQAEADLRPALPLARDSARVGSDLVGLPHTVDVPVMVYRRSRVEQAVREWARARPQIEALFKAYNGRGLPANYALEPDPAQWDSYDLAVAAYTWAHTAFDGMQAPRLAHRGYDSPETALDLYAEIYAQGGSAEDVLRVDADPVLDAFTWEAFLTRNGLVPAASWQERWGLGAIWSALRDRRVFLTFMRPNEFALLHGGSVKEATGLVDDPEDLAVAPLPRGVSLELDAGGEPARRGDGAAPAAVTYWTIPRQAPDGARAYRLAQALGSDAVLAKEAATFAAVPARPDALEALDESTPDWVRALLTVGARQARASRLLPTVPNASLIGLQYVTAWRELAAGQAPLGDGPIDRAALRGWLASYAERVRALQE